MSGPHENRLFTFLSSSFRAVGDAMRTNPRHGSSSRARLEWSGSPGGKPARARLIDISRAGAALLINAPLPAPGALVRVRLVGHESTPWIEARVLGADPSTRGRHRLRLRFVEPCPTYFLRVAVLGPMASDSAGQDETSAPSAPPLDEEAHLDDAYLPALGAEASADEDAF